MAWMFASALVAGLIGYTTAAKNFVYLLKPFASRVPQERHIAFISVGWAHSASYLSGFIGGIILWIKTWKRKGVPAAQKNQTAN